MKSKLGVSYKSERLGRQSLKWCGDISEKLSVVFRVLLVESTKWSIIRVKEQASYETLWRKRICNL